MIEIRIKDVELTEDITPEQDARWTKIHEHLSEVVNLISESENSEEMYGILCASLCMLFNIDLDCEEKHINEVEKMAINLIKISNMEDK